MHRAVDHHGRDVVVGVSTILLAAAYVAASPKTADLAAIEYRAHLFATEGWALINLQWYGGHDVPGYSVAVPALASLIGPVVLAAIAGVMSVFLVGLVVSPYISARGRLAVMLVFLPSVAAGVLVGRVTFTVGCAIGLAALAAAVRRRAVLTCASSVSTALCSPVAGLFLCVAFAAAALGGRSGDRRRWGSFAAMTLAVGVLLNVVIFPEGGTQPDPALSFLPVAVVSVGVVLVAPVARRSVRIGCLLALGLLVASYAIPSPIGSNADRLVVGFGPAALVAAWSSVPTGVGARSFHVTAALVLVLGALVVLEVRAGVDALANSVEDRSTQRSYYDPLLQFLARSARPGDRIEIPFTLNHWETVYVAPRFALARGWERQLDVRYNGLFYDGRRLTVGRYEGWLRRSGVRWIALPNSPLDSSGRQEARMLRSSPSYLRRVFVSRDWTVWEYPRGRTIQGSARVTATEADEVDLVASRAGRVLLRIHFTPYLRLVAGAGCITPSRLGWTRLAVKRPGPLRLRSGFSVQRLLSDDPNCRS
jgi:hypothetical protein